MTPTPTPPIKSNPAEDYALLRKLLDDMIARHARRYVQEPSITVHTLKEALYKFDTDRVLRQLRAAEQAQHQDA